MSKHSVVVLQDDEETLSVVIKTVNSMEEFEVVGAESDGEKGVALIKLRKPEFIITGIILKSLDGFAVMGKLAEEGIKSKIIVLSSFVRDAIIKRAIDSGATFYIAKPYKEEALKQRLIELIADGEEVRPTEVKRVLDEKISKIIITVGIPPHIKGYQYLREGVKMAVSNPNIINNITKQLYPKIGEKYDTTPSKVERAIRHAIEVAWSRGRIESINALLGIRAYVGNDKPTNGEFIALIADKMLLDGVY